MIAITAGRSLKASPRHRGGLGGLIDPELIPRSRHESPQRGHLATCPVTSYPLALDGWRRRKEGRSLRRRVGGCAPAPRPLPLGHYDREALMDKCPQNNTARKGAILLGPSTYMSLGLPSNCASNTLSEILTQERFLLMNLSAIYRRLPGTVL